MQIQILVIHYHLYNKIYIKQCILVVDDDNRCVTSPAAAYQRAVDYLNTYTTPVFIICICVIIIQVLAIVISIYYLCCKKSLYSDYDEDDNDFEVTTINKMTKRVTVKRPEDGIRRRRGFYHIF